MPDRKSPIAGGHTYSFKWADGRLTPTSGGRYAETGEAADVEVTVNLFLSEARLLCGQIKVATVPTDPWQEQHTLGPPREDPAHIDTALWRALPIGQLVEETFAGIRHTAGRVFSELGDDYLGQVASSVPARPKRGPKPSLTPELLARVVAPAFRAGGRKPVESVREALQDHGYPGSGPDGSVTIDQARKAVKKTREEGLIPAARRPGGAAQ